MNSTWFDENGINDFALKHCYQFDIDASCLIQILYLPTFSNDFFLQMYWDRYSIYFIKTLSIKKYGEADVLVLKTGKTDVENGKALLASIESFELKALPFQEVGLGRDGATIEFAMKKSFATFCCSFWTCATPKEWLPLEKLVNEILDFEKSITYLEKESQTLESMSDDFGASKSILLEFRDVK